MASADRGPADLAASADLGGRAASAGREGLAALVVSVASAQGQADPVALAASADRAGPADLEASAGPAASADRVARGDGRGTAASVLLPGPATFPNRPPTYNVNRQGLVNQGNIVRNNFNHFGAFRGGWWNRYPGAWRAARWAGAGALLWGAASWASCANYCGYPAEPVYYDYGSNVVYEDNNVYYNGDLLGTAVQYAQQAVTIADTGRQALASKDEEWLPLGVFAMVQGDQSDGNDLFQLAVNKAGIIRGNYYNALSDTTFPVYGSVDKKTQRAAWTVGDKKETVYEAGFANLTKAETTLLVHFGKDRTQQWTLIRVEQPPDQK